MELLSYLNPVSVLGVSLFMVALLYLRDEYLNTPSTATEPLAAGNVSRYAATAAAITVLGGLLVLWLQVSTVSFGLLGLIVVLSFGVVLLETFSDWRTQLRQLSGLLLLVGVAFCLLYFWPW